MRNNGENDFPLEIVGIFTVSPRRAGTQRHALVGRRLRSRESKTVFLELLLSLLLYYAILDLPSLFAPLTLHRECRRDV